MRPHWGRLSVMTPSDSGFRASSAAVTSFLASATNLSACASFTRPAGGPRLDVMAPRTSTTARPPGLCRNQIFNPTSM